MPAAFLRRLIPFHWQLRHRRNKACRDYHRATITFPTAVTNPTPSERAAATANLQRLHHLMRASTRHYLYFEAQRLHIRVPSVDDTTYYDGRDYLTAEGEAWFWAQINDLKKRRREVITGYLTAFTGILGATIGLIATARTCTPHTGASSASPEFVVLVSNPSPSPTTVAPTPKHP